MIKLSLCVPIYGVEKEIPRFLSSLERNLHPDIEVLLVDDGAKDNSGKIADDFAAKHPDIVRMIHKPNGGLSSARNKGLESAKGEYVVFPDPDDILADDYVSTVLEAIDKYDSPDLILFDFYTGEKLSKMKRKTVSAFREGRVSKEAFFREDIKDKDIRGYAWNKAIKRTFYKGRGFDSRIRVGEDYAILTEMLADMGSFVYIPKATYYYMRRPGSLTGTRSIRDGWRYCELVIDRYRKHSEIYADLSLYGVIIRAANMIRRIYIEHADVDPKPLKRWIDENIGTVLTSSEFSLGEKKRVFFIWSGIGKYYYGKKKKK